MTTVHRGPLEASDRLAEPFRSGWWLRAAAPEAEGGLLWIGATDQPLARFAWLRTRRWGLHRIVPPPLTPVFAPWVAPLSGRRHRVVSRYHELVGAILAALPPHDQVRLRLEAERADWLPYLWHGFHARVRYTYRLPPAPETALWQGLSEATRRRIRKARRHFEVTSGTCSELWHCNEATFTRQDRPVPFAATTLERLTEAAAAHDAGEILVARTEGGTVAAAIWLVWSDTVTYYLAGGATETGRRGGALSLLLWEGILRARAAGRTFDFEGSMLPAIERFFRGFGAQPVRWLELEATPRRWLRRLLALREALR